MTIAYLSIGSNKGDKKQNCHEAMKRLEEIEAALEAAGAPWTPGRVPRWEME